MYGASKEHIWHIIEVVELKAIEIPLNISINRLDGLLKHTVKWFRLKTQHDVIYFDGLSCETYISHSCDPKILEKFIVKRLALHRWKKTEVRSLMLFEYILDNHYFVYLVWVFVAEKTKAIRVSLTKTISGFMRKNVWNHSCKNCNPFLWKHISLSVIEKTQRISYIFTFD